LRIDIHPFINRRQAEPIEIARLRARYPRLRPAIQYTSTVDLLQKLDRIFKNA
jgi:hypothetical protein